MQETRPFSTVVGKSPHSSSSAGERNTRRAIFATFPKRPPFDPIGVHMADRSKIEKIPSTLCVRTDRRVRSDRRQATQPQGHRRGTHLASNSETAAGPAYNFRSGPRIPFIPLSTLCEVNFGDETGPGTTDPGGEPENRIEPCSLVAGTCKGCRRPELPSQVLFRRVSPPASTCAAPYSRHTISRLLPARTSMTR